MANKAIFLDRDDTLVEDPGYMNHPDQLKLLDGIPEALSALKSMGYKLVIVSNQSGVARGIVTEEVLSEIHKRLEQMLAEKGASLDRIYYCPYHPEGVIPKYRRQSEYRKPNPGMLLAASKDMDIDLKESWMVGNGPDDIEAGARAGCRTIMVDSRAHEHNIQPGARAPDYRAVNMAEVVNIIKMNARSAQSRPVTVAEQPEQLSSQETQQQTESHQEAPIAAEKQMKTDQLLGSILEQLKSMQRANMFGEFSTSRLIAGIIQGLVFFCVLVSIWFLTSPARQFNSVLISLGFAILLQLMALSFYMMRGPK